MLASFFAPSFVQAARPKMARKANSCPCLGFYSIIPIRGNSSHLGAGFGFLADFWLPLFPSSVFYILLLLP